MREIREFSLDNAKLLSTGKESCFEEIHDKGKAVDLHKQKDISCQVLFMYGFGFFTVLPSTLQHSSVIAGSVWMSG